MPLRADSRRTKSSVQHEDSLMRVARKRNKNGLAMLVVPYLVLGPWLQRHGVLAGWRGQAIASAGLIYLVYRLVTFRRWNDEVKHARALSVLPDFASRRSAWVAPGSITNARRTPCLRSLADAGRFIVTFTVLLGVLFIDNFCIWCASDPCTQLPHCASKCCNHKARPVSLPHELILRNIWRDGPLVISSCFTQLGCAGRCRRRTCASTTRRSRCRTTC